MCGGAVFAFAIHSDYSFSVCRTECYRNEENYLENEDGNKRKLVHSNVISWFILSKFVKEPLYILCSTVLSDIIYKQ
jgi:hypothetical protein